MDISDATTMVGWRHAPLGGMVVESAIRTDLTLLMAQMRAEVNPAVLTVPEQRLSLSKKEKKRVDLGSNAGRSLWIISYPPGYSQGRQAGPYDGREYYIYKSVTYGNDAGSVMAVLPRAEVSSPAVISSFPHGGIMLCSGG